MRRDIHYTHSTTHPARLSAQITDGSLKDARSKFIRDDAGAIEHMRLGLRINPRVK